MHTLYVDDLTEAEAINLKKQLVKINHNTNRPLSYHERTEHYFPPANSLLQKNLKNIENYTVNNLMKVNKKKTNIMLFNRSKKYDFLPTISFSDGEPLEVINETKLLGVVIQSNLSWTANTIYLVKRAMSRMWLLRRMKLLGLEPNFILDYYLKEIRPVVEHGVPVWHSGLTNLQSNKLERIQKVALRIILGEHYDTYNNACKKFSLVKLSERRDRLCSKFAAKLYLGSRRRQFFSPPDNQKFTRNSGKQIVKEKVTRTKRAFNAPQNYLARLINQNKEKILRKQKGQTK